MAHTRAWVWNWGAWLVWLGQKEGGAEQQLKPQRWAVSIPSVAQGFGMTS